MYATQPIESDQMSESEYLAFEETSEIKHEYCGGRIYAMTGGSLRHSIITVNTSTHLNNLLVDRDCTVTSSDLRIHIAEKKSYRYPDVTVFCGKPVYVDDRTDTIANPSVVVEVLSPSTALIDINDKLEEYTQIKSLQAYIIIAQSQPKIERFIRHEADQWLYQYVTGLDTSIEIPALNCTLTLSKIYQKVDWDDKPNAD